MSTSTVTVQISATDAASPVLARVAAQAHKIVEDAKRAADVAGRAYSTIGNSAANAAQQNADKINRAFRNVANDGVLAKGIGVASAFVVGAFGAMAAKSIKHINEIVTKLDDVEKRMRAFGGATPEQAKKITESSIKEGANLPGGPTAFQGAAYEAVKANINPEAAPVAARHGVRFGHMIASEKGTEELIQLMNIFGYTRNAEGERVQPDKLTPQELDAALIRTRARYIRESKRLPGKESDLLEAYKMAGPSMIAAGVPEELQQAMILNMAQGGITGSHGGQYARGIIQRMVAPSGPARQAFTSLGVDPGTYATIGESKISQEHFEASLRQRGIALKGEGKKEAADIFDKMRAGSMTFPETRDALAELVKREGAKDGKKNGVVDDKAAVAAVNNALTPWIEKFDFKGLFEKLREVKAPPSAVAKMFGLESGTGANIMLQTDIAKDVDELRKERESTDPKKLIEETDKIIDSSFKRQQERFHTNVDATVANSFNDIKGPVGTTLDAASKGMTYFRDNKIEIDANAKMAPFAGSANALVFFYQNTSRAAEATGALADKLKQGEGTGKTLQQRADESRHEVQSHDTADADAKREGYRRQISEFGDWLVNHLRTPFGVPATVDHPAQSKPEWPGAVMPAQPGAPAQSGAAWESGTERAVKVESTVTGTVQGEASIKVDVNVKESPLLDARLSGIERDMLRLHGVINSATTGVSMAGKNGAGVKPSTGMLGAP